jgi:formiminotetrahydrofolate cyclodeaminase
MTSLSDNSLAALVQRVASTDPAPGAGPSLAWTCALAAALVEMVSAIALGKDPTEAAATASRRDRAATLRAQALELADRDVVAYSEVLSVLRRRDEPGHGGRLRKALSDAADPPLAIVEIAAELCSLAADAACEARGAVRGEAITAAVLAEAVVRAGTPIVDLNLAGARDDPRAARVRELAPVARAGLDRALGT